MPPSPPIDEVVVEEPRTGPNSPNPSSWVQTTAVLSMSSPDLPTNP